jgi:hypothetical protein
VAHLEAGIPQRIEDTGGQRLGLLIEPRPVDEQEIHVGAREQPAPAEAADRHHAHGRLFGADRTGHGLFDEGRSLVQGEKRAA